MGKISPHFQGDNSKKYTMQILKTTHLKPILGFRVNFLGYNSNSKQRHLRNLNHPTPSPKTPRFPPIVLLFAWSLVELMGPRNKRLLAINTSTSVPCLFTWRRDEGDQGRFSQGGWICPVFFGGNDHRVFGG